MRRRWGSDVSTNIEAIADRLLAAYDGPPIAPVRTALADGDVAAAYAVQMVQVRRWLEGGRRLAGRKIGLTAKAVQKQLGVDEPDFGHLFADMIYGDGEEAPSTRLQQPRIEAEVAVRLGRDLDMDQITISDVIGAVDYVAPALEVVGSRIKGWDINILDTVADNASSSLLAIGGPVRRLDGLDLVDCAMGMRINGQAVSTGKGSACLGSPLNALVWLARRARSLGSPLRAGELIMTGALGPMAPIAPGDWVEASIEGLGSVRLAIGAETSTAPVL
jgi:2-keto-4-pentenoate hydratase